MDLKHEEFTVRCTDCNVDILEICDRKKEKTRKLRVRCPKCKNLTFYFKISEDIGFIPCNSFCVVDIIEDGNVIIEVV